MRPIKLLAISLGSFPLILAKAAFAWTLIASTYVNGNFSSSVATSPINNTGADICIATAVEAYNFGQSASPSIIDNALHPYTYENSINYPGGGGATEVWYYKNPTTSSSYTVTWNGSGPSAGESGGTLVLSCWSGSNSGTVTDQFNSSVSTTATTTSQPGSITPSINNALVIVSAYTSPGVTRSFSSPYTFLNGSTGSTGVYIGNYTAYYIQPTAAATNPTITASSSDVYMNAIASFQPSGAAPAGTKFVMPHAIP